MLLEDRVAPAAAVARRLLVDERGQDVIEYALLSAFVGVAGAAVFSAMEGTMKTAYSNWNDAAQSDALVETRDPLDWTEQ